VARVLPCRRKEAPPAPTEPESPLLDPALSARAPLETVEELSRRIGVPLMPIPGEEDR
jgi:hypothetical protein